MDPTTLQAAKDATKLAVLLFKKLAEILRHIPSPSELWYRCATFAHLQHMWWTPFGSTNGLYGTGVYESLIFRIEKELKLKFDMRRFFRGGGWFSIVCPKTGKSADMMGRYFDHRFATLTGEDPPPRPVDFKNDPLKRDFVEFGWLCGWAVWQELTRLAGWPPGYGGDEYDELRKIDEAEKRDGQGFQYYKSEKKASLAYTKMVYDTAVWFQGELDAHSVKLGQYDVPVYTFRNGAYHHWQKVMEDRRARITQSLPEKAKEEEKLKLIIKTWAPFVEEEQQSFAARIMDPHEFVGMTARLPEGERKKHGAHWVGPPVPWAFQKVYELEKKKNDTATAMYYAIMFPEL
ncbi:MAG: hypothetical protein ACPL7K_01665, partial [Armatimonadota bacterium]